MTKENILTGEIPQSEAAQESKKRANRRKYVYLTVKYAVAAILKDGQQYTREQAIQLVTEFLERKV